MKSLRLSSELTERLQRAAVVAGESLSEFIRQAAAQRADALLDGAVDHDLADVIGAIHGGGGRARQTGKSFTEAIAERHSDR